MMSGRRPVMRALPKTIAARDYNRVRLALLRLGCPLRIPLPGLDHTDMLLDRDEWLCIDRRHGQQPLMAWTDFQAAERAALHAPIRCTVELYHSHAGVLLGTALKSLQNELAQRLQP